MKQPSKKARKKRPGAPLGNSNAAGNPGGSGAPAKYRPEYAEEAGRLALLGLTDGEMAAFFEVCEKTFHSWKKLYPDFAERLRASKVAADGHVAAALYKKAIGYRYTETTIEKAVQGEGLEMITGIKTVEKEAVPDSGAATTWLKNRHPHLWRPVIELSDEELTKLADKLNRLKKGDIG